MDATPASRAPRLALLTLGPVMTVLLLSGAEGALGANGLAMLAIIAWSPLPFSVPGLLLQNERDAALPHYRGPRDSIVRAVLLVPYLMAKPGVRLEMGLSLAAWFVVLAAAWPAASQMLTS